MSRNYKKEYDNYHSRPEQKIRRAARNAARRLFTDADPDKDVHHKDNNPLNNDKKNLSLVTQYYNRREPRLRDEAFPKGHGSTVIVHNNKVIAKGAKSAMLKQMKQIRKKTGDSHKKLFLGNSPSRKIGDVWKEDTASRAKEIADLRAKHRDEIEKEREDNEKEREAQKKEREDKKKEGEAAREEVEFDESPIVVSNEVMAIKIIVGKFEDLLKKSNFNKKQKLAKALGIRVSMRGKHSVSVEQDEEIGTVTGPHIVGTGDDSSTVVVKKKKKKQVYRREAVEKKIIDNVLAKTHNKNGIIK